MTAWSALRARRDAGDDPALSAKAAKAEQAAQKLIEVYTVRRLCDDYLAGHVDVHRKGKGAKEMHRLMGTYIDSIAQRPASSITRSDAFSLLEGMANTPAGHQGGLQPTRLRPGAPDLAGAAGREAGGALRLWGFT